MTKKTSAKKKKWSIACTPASPNSRVYWPFPLPLWNSFLELPEVLFSQAAVLILPQIKITHNSHILHFFKKSTLPWLYWDMFKDLCFPSVTSHVLIPLTHLPPAVCSVLPFFDLILPPFGLKAASGNSWLGFDGQTHILSKKEVRFTSLL